MEEDGYILNKEPRTDLGAMQECQKCGGNIFRVYWNKFMASNECCTCGEVVED